MTKLALRRGVGPKGPKTESRRRKNVFPEEHTRPVRPRGPWPDDPALRGGAVKMGSEPLVGLARETVDPKGPSKPAWLEKTGPGGGFRCGILFPGRPRVGGNPRNKTMRKFYEFVRRPA